MIKPSTSRNATSCSFIYPPPGVIMYHLGHGLYVPRGTCECNEKERPVRKNFWSDVWPRLLRPGRLISAWIDWQRALESASVCWFIISAAAKTSKRELWHFLRKDCGDSLHPNHFPLVSLRK